MLDKHAWVSNLTVLPLPLPKDCIQPKRWCTSAICQIITFGLSARLIKAVQFRPYNQEREWRSGGKMVRLSDTDVMLPICAGRSVTFLLQPDYRQAMQLADKIFPLSHRRCSGIRQWTPFWFSNIDFFWAGRRTLGSFNLTFQHGRQAWCGFPQSLQGKALRHVENGLQLQTEWDEHRFPNCRCRVTPASVSASTKGGQSWDSKRGSSWLELSHDVWLSHLVHDNISNYRQKY